MSGPQVTAQLKEAIYRRADPTLLRLVQAAERVLRENNPLLWDETGWPSASD